jgi:DNA-binding response OmpR family regulator
MKILLIEDDIATIEVIRLCTQIHCPESEMVPASQGLAGIEKLKTDRFDVVLIDLGLPDIDGLDVLEQIRGFSKVPVMIISACHNMEAMGKARNLGASDYITKPFDFHFLVKRLAEIAGQNQNSQKLVKQISLY